MTITEFLLARITEDEAAARAATQSVKWWHWPETEPTSGVSGSVRTHESPYVALNLRWPDAAHIARWEPNRVLAECEAKRRIVVEEHGVDLFGGCSTCADGAHLDSMDDEEEGSVLVALVDYTEHPCTTLRLLALPYADHPDYQQGWKP